MKYLIGIIILFSLSISAVNETSDKTDNNNKIIEKIKQKKGTIDITNNSNPVVKFCNANGGTFVPDKQRCTLPNNVDYDALDYWSFGINNWNDDDWDYYNLYLND